MWQKRKMDETEEKRRSKNRNMLGNLDRIV